MKREVAIFFLSLMALSAIVSASVFSELFEKKSPGLSPEDACSDTDGYLVFNQSIFFKGSITGLDAYGKVQTYFDSCSTTTPNNVLEYYCNMSVPAPNIKRSSVPCPVDSVCVDGACAYPTIPPTNGSSGENNETPVNDSITCEDSDGDNIYTKGKVDRCEGESCGGAFDICASSSHVTERLCGDTEIISKNYECPSGFSCNDGACRQTNTSEQDFCYLINANIVAKARSIESSGDYVGYLEGGKIFKGGFAIIPGTILQVMQIYNDSSSYFDDEITLKDAFTGEYYTFKAYQEGVIIAQIKGDNYIINYYGSSSIPSEDRYIRINFPQTIGAAKADFSQCNFASPNTCQPLIDALSSIVDGEVNGDFEFEGINFQLSHSNKWENNYWIDNGKEEATEFTASWWGSGYDESYYYRQSVIVFDNSEVDLESWLQDKLSWDVCKTVDFYNDYETSEEREIVYVCNWRAMWPGGEVGNSKELEIIWIKDNVIVQAYTNIGQYLTEEQLQLLYSRKFNDFINALQNNPREYIGWEYLGLQWPFRDLVGELLELCPSEVPIPTDDEGNECYPSWECKTEPLICPEHGYQTRTCYDYSCGKQISQKFDCNPAICSGCYVPKWLGSDYSSKCIPYGFRFAQEVEGPLVLKEFTEDETVNQVTTNDYKLEVLSDTEAKLTFYGKDGAAIEYTLTEDQYTKIDLPYWDDEIQHVQIYAKNIVYYGTDNSNNYVDLTFTVLGIERRIDTFNAYCEIDGEVKLQKTKDKYTGDWASCQNNYECDSNLCSGGQCVEINDAIREAGEFKSLFYRVFCRLANAFSEAEYNSCVAEFVGFGETPSEPGGSGGGSAPAP